MPRPVVAGVDESPESLAAAEWAAAEALRRDAPLRLVHAWNWTLHPAFDVPAAAMVASAAQRTRAMRLLEQAKGRARAAAPTLSVAVEAKEGPASTALLRAAEGAEILVLGSRGLGAVSGVLVGSVAQSVAGRTPVPLVLVREGATPHDAGTHRDVVLGLDLGDPCDEVIQFAFTEADLRGARLKVVSAWKSPALYTLGPGEVALAQGGPQRASEWQGFQDAVLHSWRDAYPNVAVTGTAIEGSAATPLLRAASGACLLVVGRRAREGHHLGPSNGPVTHEAMHHARCPVAVIPHK
ncbi:universal stress protein [Streptomyces sp. NPDC050095]|uniref:universal stress protein n=1 Tax=unclassified Streptomyces TaxID=2593676 RepID=UPI00341F381E